MDKEVKDEIVDGGISKPTEAPIETAPVEKTAPVEVKPVETDGDVGEDISDVIEILNEFQKMAGGKGDITDIPENLRGTIKFAIEKMVTIRDLFEDPLFKQVLDDLVDQKEDGKTPSVLVAVARTIPLEEIQEISDSENYEEIQGAVDQRLASDKESQDKEASLYASFDESQKAGKDYCEKMGYDDEETNQLFTLAMDWFKILGDGKIDEEEWSKIDKMKNYDSDTQALREGMPKEQTKEVLPDKSSIQAIQTPAPTEKKSKGPSNSLEAMSAAIPDSPSYLKPRRSTSSRR